MSCFEINSRQWYKRYIFTLWSRNKIQNPETFCLWDPESWALESRIYSTRNPNTKDSLESRIQVPLKKTEIQYLESRIHGMESRIQECLTPLHAAI